MGAKGKNFYNALACRYGYEKEAAEIQDLYLSGKKKEAAALVPAELLEATSLCGPESYIKERVAALAEAGVTHLNVTPVGARSGRHDRKAAKLGVAAAPAAPGPAEADGPGPPERSTHARPGHPGRHDRRRLGTADPHRRRRHRRQRHHRGRRGRRARRRREIDADGLLVTPGWVDIHTHYDGQATWDPEVSPSGWHGVTTVVMGNCGVGFAPARESDRAWLIQLMEGVEDIPGTALAEGMNWNWETFGEYLDEVERTPRVLDVASLVPHGALRAYVLGEGRANDTATAEEIAEMAAIVREAVQAGAIGASTTRTVLHRAKDGELAAGTTAAADELIAIGEALGKAGHRVFSVASDMWDLDHEFAWMSEISVRAGVPVTYQVLQADFNPDLWREWIDRGVAANRRGAWLVPQVAGKPTSLMVGFQSVTHPFAHHRAYQEIADLPLDERVARLRTPEVRAAILGEEPRARRLRGAAAGQPAQAVPAGRPARLRAAARAQRHRARRRAGADDRRGPLRPDAPAGRTRAPLPAAARLLGTATSMPSARCWSTRPRCSAWATAAPTAACCATPACRRSC